LGNVTGVLKITRLIRKRGGGWTQKEKQVRGRMCDQRERTNQRVKKVNEKAT